MVMKLQAILLGEYGSSPPTPFCIYQHDHSKLYLCVEDINALLGGYNTLSSRHLHPDHVLTTTCERRSFLLTDSVIPIARSRHMLALAELCQLTPAELMAGVVAAPLLASLGVIAAVPGRLVHHPMDAIHVMSHHRHLSPHQQQQHFDSWLTHHQQRCDHKKQKNQSNHATTITRDLHREEQRLASFMQRLSHHPLWRGMRQQQQSSSSDMWARFASWFGDYHHDQKLRASFLGTFKTQRQQQAIIASRQRRSALKDTASTTGPGTTITNHTPHHRVIKKRRSNSNTALANHQHEQQQQQQQPMDSSSSCCSSRSSTPKPSLRQQHSPVIRSCRSVTELHRPVPCKALQLPPPWPSPSAGLADQLLQPRKWASFHDLRGESNLDLLATQATQQQPMQQFMSSCPSSSSSSPSSQSSSSSLPPPPPLRSPPPSHHFHHHHHHHHHHSATSAIQLPSPSEMLARRHHPPPTGLV